MVGLVLLPAITGIGCWGYPTRDAIGINSVTISPRSGAMAVGERLFFDVYAVDEADAVLSDFDANWTTTDNSVARVDAFGFVTGLLKGQVYVRARYGGVRDSVPLTVVDSVDLARHVAIWPAIGSLLLGATRIYQAVVRDSLARILPVPVRWSVSDSTLASITSQGVLTALQVGSLSVYGDVGPVHASVPLRIIAPTP